MHFSTLAEWLTCIENIHNGQIKLGIDRIKAVAAKLDILAFDCPVIIVGGTNGKGSTVAALEAIYLANGYRVGAYTSPVLFKHNEQVRIDNQLARDEEFCAAYEKVASALDGTMLTSFEFQTLAAFLIFKTYLLDIIILEVGLGGRLDAVNIIDADVAVITSIGIDHVDWLGSTRDAIGYEKAGIFRSQKPAVCGDRNPPLSLIHHAKKTGTPLFCQGNDFSYEENQQKWSWRHQQIEYSFLPLVSLSLDNMSTALMAITLLQNRLPVYEEAVVRGLKSIKLRGRIEVIHEPVTKIFDVAHNPAAIELLKNYLKKNPILGKTHAVFSMLADKDLLGSVEIIREAIHDWYVASLPIPRAASIEKMAGIFQKAHIQSVSFFSSITTAYDHALLNSQVGDRIVVFGSFHTVANILRHADQMIEPSSKAACTLNALAHIST